MKIVLLGCPGSGKGTQAKQISKKYNICHISTGEIFRNNIKEMTPLGIEAKKFIDKGQLVPDDLTLEIVEDRIKMDDCRNGFIFDGFPRTIYQADALNKFLSLNNTKLDFAIDIAVPEDIVISRITGRRVCTNCAANFHVVYNIPKLENVCDFCGSKLIQRDDDNEATVKRRLDVYFKQTEPLIDYYKNQKCLKSIDGTQDIDKVFNDICNILGSVNG